MSADAIVIGGGFAGLSAATAMAEHGLRVKVFEAKASLGGRASTITDPVTGARADTARHVVFGWYTETLRFLRRIGAADAVGLRPDLVVDMIDRGGHASQLACARLGSSFHLMAGAMRWRALAWRDRIALLRVRGGTRGRELPDPSLTARDWLAEAKQTDRLIEMLWEPLALAALNESIEHASARAFAVVLQRVLGSEAPQATFGVFRSLLEEAYVSPATAYIEARRGQVRGNAPCKVVTEGGVRVLAKDKTHTVRAVVCAVPWFALRDLFIEEPAALSETLANARRTASHPIVIVNLWLDRPLLSSGFVGLPGRRMQCAIEERIQGGDNAWLSLVFKAADDLIHHKDEDIVALATSELGAAVPLARAAQVRRAVVVREKQASFTLAPNAPARPSVRTGVPGLFLAGDWIDTGLPATIESAVVSGHMAADAVVNSLRKP